MQPPEIVVFAAALFFALAALIQWKRRRDVAAARVNRGLRGYVSADSTVRLPVPKKSHGENLLPV